MTSKLLEDSLAQAAVTEVDRLCELLFATSKSIHAHPELGFEEHFAHDLLCETIESFGLPVQRGAFGLETAFSCDVRYGTGPSVVIILEYDALPGIGHACGHNVIAASGLGAGLACAKIMQECGGSVRILGTPAEEGGGGKILMARNGAFDDLAAALMLHPADHDLIRMNAIAIQELEAKYQGVAAHAAASPHEGRNALDAAVLGYNSVAALRQHIRDSERIHGIFTKGGDKPNVVPAEAETLWYVRSDTVQSLRPLKDRVAQALTGAAISCGCQVQLKWQDFAYANMLDDPVLCTAYKDLAHGIGRSVAEPGLEVKVVGSTDMGNVSHLVPSIHPMIAITEPGVPIHTAEFAEAAIGRGADIGIRDGAILLTQLALTVSTNTEFRLSLGTAIPADLDPNAVIFS